MDRPDAAAAAAATWPRQGSLRPRRDLKNTHHLGVRTGVPRRLAG